MRIIALLLFGLLFSTPLLAQSGPLDVGYANILADRNKFGRVVHLFGDSIFRGKALNRYPDEYSPEEIRTEARWPLRSPASMLNQFFAARGLARLDEFDNVIGGDVVAGYAGGSGQPTESGVRGVAHTISVSSKRGIIRPGDFVVLEDAGDHAQDPDIYQSNWGILLEALKVSKVTVVMLDMFDYLEGETLGPYPSNLFRYDVKFKGGRTGRMRSHNEATLAAFTEYRDDATDAALIRADTLMDTFQNETRRLYSVPVMHSDGIHPNVWGQCLISGAIAKAIGEKVSLARIAKAIENNVVSLGYGTKSPNWNKEAALSTLRTCAEPSGI